MLPPTAVPADSATLVVSDLRRYVPMPGAPVTLSVATRPAMQNRPTARLATGSSATAYSSTTVSGASASTTDSALAALSPTTSPTTSDPPVRFVSASVVVGVPVT